MSFLDSGNKGFRWVAAPLKRSVSLAPGCAQCGRRLEVNAQGGFALSGKCDDCTYGVFDEDGFIDESEY